MCLFQSNNSLFLIRTGKRLAFGRRLQPRQPFGFFLGPRTWFPKDTSLVLVFTVGSTKQKIVSILGLEACRAPTVAVSKLGQPPPLAKGQRNTDTAHSGVWRDRGIAAPRDAVLPGFLGIVPHDARRVMR